MRWTQIHMNNFCRTTRMFELVNWTVLATRWEDHAGLQQKLAKASPVNPSMQPQGLGCD
jgi:hypothetical protein